MQHEIHSQPHIPLEPKERLKSSFNGVPKIFKTHISSVKNTQKFGLSVDYAGTAMVKVDTITCGAFGELSLTQEKVGLRMASILAEEDTHFAVLDKKSYEVLIFCTC